MKKKKLIWILIILLAAIQFIRPEQNTSVQPLPQSFIDTFQVTDKVKTLLTTSCFDCHSNNTRYPWYTHIQPVGWILASHIREGKEKLNFNEVASLSPRRRNSKFKSITEQIENGEMPLKSYLQMHKDVKLSERDKNILIHFFQSKMKE
ncbi:heme-binding domain-containing protein [Haoranjiania flava]|uniref:Heme-binding domain-containing protein n=1 Tax=Haoranjiania flava TaxID=1856322 RepID=A0AAE3ILK0_9BACT|nr:heme-binding domain-containing protein [Haoranjiania flava]MCU7694390.1 heme-binding domain-containing protein [Haoranjiania flava]